MVLESNYSDPFNDENVMWSVIEQSLGRLAAAWRYATRHSKSDRATEIAHAYQGIMKFIWDLGWRGKGLLPDEELPEALMPEYFLEYWRKQK